MSVEFDARKLKKLEDMLNFFSDKALPIASQQAINEGAFKTMQGGRKNVREKMINRNKFTERSIAFERARGLDVSKQEARIGSIQPYMKKQEFGGTERAKGRHGVQIPTSSSTGEGQEAKPRKRLTKRSMSMQTIKLKKIRGPQGGSRKKQIIMRAMEVRKNNDNFAYLDLGRKKGLFHIKGKVKKSGGISGLRVTMVHDLSQRNIAIPKTPWLEPAFNKVERSMPRIYEKKMLAQLKRFKAI